MTDYPQEIQGRNFILAEQLRILQTKNQALLVNVLSIKVRIEITFLCVEDKNAVLKAHLQESLFRQEDVENEAIRLRGCIGRTNIENQKLTMKVKNLEEKLYKKPEPPPPPPQPTKSLFSNLKNPFLKKSKQFRSVPENMHIPHARQGNSFQLYVSCMFS